MVELLSPAGNKDSFKAAIENGADAVYMGLSKFNAREMAENFSVEEYIECITYAHIRGAKVYLTLNTLMYDDEIEPAILQLIKLYKHGLDAVIVQDIGLAMAIKQVIPEIHLHASTQMSIHNLKQVKFLENIGFSRVVLGRELSTEEIGYICKNTKMEVEVFVHGALCVSYSGQCLMSSMIGSRSGNRGKCAQTCRMKYSLYENPDKLIESKKYLLSKKDIFGINHLKKLSEAGVKSFKIEGRGKIAEYVAGVTKTYRNHIDEDISEIGEEQKNKLMQIFNRDGVSSGYLNGVPGKESITLNSPKNTGLILGEVLEQKKQFVKVKLEQDIDMHDGIEIHSKNEICSTIVTCIKKENFETDNKLIQNGRIVWLGDINKSVQVGSVIYKTSSAKLNEELNKTYSQVGYIRKVPIKAEISVKANQKISINIKDEKINIYYESQYIPEEAVNKSIDEVYVVSQIEKTNDTPFVFTEIQVDLDNGLYVSMSKLNEIRKKALAKFEENFITNIDDKIYRDNLAKLLVQHNKVLNDKLNKDFKKVENRIFVFSYDDKKDYLTKECSGIYFNISDVFKFESQIFSKYLEKTKIYLYIPNIVNENLDKIIKNNLENYIDAGVAGVLLGNIGYVDSLNEMRKKYSFEIISDYSLNVTNTFSANFYKDLGIDVITPSMEIDLNEINKISKILPVEIVKDFVSVMTSRYCIVGSFVANRKIGEKCSMPCVKHEYYMVDTFGLKYYLVCDNTDCIMSVVRKIGESVNVKDVDNLINTRKCII